LKKNNSEQKYIKLNHKTLEQTNAKIILISAISESSAVVSATSESSAVAMIILISATGESSAV